MLAFVWLLPGVQSLVAPESRGLAEVPVAVLTLIRPLSRVDPCVRPQTALRAEQPLAFVAAPTRAVLRLREHVVD